MMGTFEALQFTMCPTLKIADSLAHLDPMVQSGRLQIEIRPWWAGKGYGMR